jgi:hypothetical protein
LTGKNSEVEGKTWGKIRGCQQKRGKRKRKKGGVEERRDKITDSTYGNVITTP